MTFKKILAIFFAAMLMGMSTLNVSVDAIKTNAITQFVSIEEDVFTPFNCDLTSDDVQVYNNSEISVLKGNDDALYIDDDSVIVVFKKEYSELNKVWTSEDLKCPNITSVEDLTYLDFTEEEKK